MVKHFVFLFLFATGLIFHTNTFANKPEVELSLSKSTVWQREQVIATLTVKSKDTLSRIEAEEFEQEGFFILPAEIERTENDEGVETTLKWILFPYLAEEKKLEFPRIRYRPSTSRPRSLKLPEQLLKVRPLPIYVPPTMPVGKVTLKQDWQNGFIITAKKLFDWNITAESSHVTPQTLPAISRQLTSSKSLEVFPNAKEIEQSIDETGVTLFQNYQIPVKGNVFGWLALPNIEIQYFDPNNGRLKKISTDNPKVLVIHAWMIWVMLILFAYLLYWLASRYLPKITAWLTSNKIKKKALKDLNGANNYQQIKQSLSEYSLATGKKSNTALETFADNYKNTTAYEVIKDHLNIINQVQFSNNENNHSLTESAKGLSKILAKL